MSQSGMALAVDAASPHEYSQEVDVRTEQILLKQIKGCDAAGRDGALTRRRFSTENVLFAEKRLTVPGNPDKFR